MKINAPLLVFCTVFAAAFAAFGQSPPANDKFANRTLLTGTDVTFTGTLAGATLEGWREGTVYEASNDRTSRASQSVWWTWTAPVTTTLTLEILNSSRDKREFLPADMLAVGYATDANPSATNLVLPPTGATAIYFPLIPASVSIPVFAGKPYQIQLIGTSSATYTIRLIATDLPVIVQQPRSQAVYSNASALLYVVTAGTRQKAFTFQWRLNGTNLPDETAPMIAFNKINAGMAGDYSVIVRNTAGYTISQTATLTVVGVGSDSPLTPDGAAQKSVRVTPPVLNPPDAEICINNLRKISVAKMLWERDSAETHMDVGFPVFTSLTSTPASAQLLRYFPRNLWPYCPDDPSRDFHSSYSVQNLLESPVCDIYPTVHLLKQPE